MMNARFPFWIQTYSDPFISCLALDNIKEFLHDDWQMQPTLEWNDDPQDLDIEDGYSDSDFDPEDAHDRLLEMMDRFGAN